jgi:hypothetical protein
MRQRSPRKIDRLLLAAQKPRIVHRRIIYRRIVPPRITRPLRRAKSRLRAAGQPPKVSPRGKPPRNRLVRPKTIRQKLMRRNRLPSLRLRMLRLRRTRPVRKVSRKLRARRILRLRLQRRNRRRRPPHQERALRSRPMKLHHERALPSPPTRLRPSLLLGRVRRNQVRQELPRLSPRRLPNQRSLRLRRSRLSRRSTNLSRQFFEDYLASVNSLAIFLASWSAARRSYRGEALAALVPRLHESTRKGLDPESSLLQFFTTMFQRKSYSKVSQRALVRWSGRAPRSLR